VEVRALAAEKSHDDAKETPQEPVKQGWWEMNAGANHVKITGIQHLVDLLANAGDKLVIVEFYGTWCGACKGVYPKLCKLIDGRDDIILAKVDFDQNKPIAKAMGVRVLPYFNFYRGADGKLDSFSASLSKVDRLRAAIAQHSAERCQLGENRGAEEFTEYFKPRQRPLGDIMGSKVDGREGAPQSNPAAGKVKQE